MRFSNVGLVLGAETILAPARASARDVTVDVTDRRLVALLAAAHLRRPASLDLAHIHKAADRWRAGDDALVAMHLALSRLSHLADPVRDAQRLFLADGLLKAGFSANTIVKALDLDASPAGRVSKYSPDQPRVPAGSGRASGEWTTDAVLPLNVALSAGPQRGSDRRQFHVELPSTIIGAVAVPPNLGPFGEAVRALADTIEVADSVSKWRELGPKGEILVAEAVRARGWELLDDQVPVRTSLGLRIEDLLVHVPAGTAGNATAYDGFIEVKVNSGRCSPLQQAKDALIGTVGGIMIGRAGRYNAGARVILETGLANVTITYGRE
jgi:hypothetical protein